MSTTEGLLDRSVFPPSDHASAVAVRATFPVPVVASTDGGITRSRSSALDIGQLAVY